MTKPQAFGRSGLCHLANGVPSRDVAKEPRCVRADTLPLDSGLYAALTYRAIRLERRPINGLQKFRGFRLTTPTGIVGKDTEDELRMLSALHGIGVIALNSEDPSESEIVVPARARQEIDWQSVNRLVEENEDMKDFVEQISTYYQTGRLRTKDWNRI